MASFVKTGVRTFPTREWHFLRISRLQEWHQALITAATAPGKLCVSEENRGQQSESFQWQNFLGGLILHFSSAAQGSSESAEADSRDSFVAARVMWKREGGHLISCQLFPLPLFWWQVEAATAPPAHKAGTGARLRRNTFEYTRARWQMPTSAGAAPSKQEFWILGRDCVLESTWAPLYSHLPAQRKLKTQRFPSRSAIGPADSLCLSPPLFLSCRLQSLLGLLVSFSVWQRWCHPAFIANEIWPRRSAEETVAGTRWTLPHPRELYFRRQCDSRMTQTAVCWVQNRALKLDLYFVHYPSKVIIFQGRERISKRNLSTSFLTITFPPKKWI